MGQSFATIHSKLVEHIANLDQAEQAITNNSSAIQQTTVASATVHQELAESVNHLGSVVENFKESVALRNPLLERLEQSTDRLLESTKKTDETCYELQKILEIAQQRNASAEEKLKQSQANHQKWEENDHQFEENLRQLMSNSNPLQRGAPKCKRSSL